MPFFFASFIITSSLHRITPSFLSYDPFLSYFLSYIWLYLLFFFSLRKIIYLKKNARTSRDFNFSFFFLYIEGIKRRTCLNFVQFSISTLPPIKFNETLQKNSLSLISLGNPQINHIIGILNARHFRADLNGGGFKFKMCSN